MKTATEIEELVKANQIGAAIDGHSSVSHWCQYCKVAAYLAALGAAVAVGGNCQVASAADGSSTVVERRISRGNTTSGSAIDEILQAQEDDIVVTQSAEKAIDDYLATKGWRLGYDAEKNRILVKVSLDFNIRDPKKSMDFISLRNAKMEELCLKGKARIVETMMREMPGSRVKTDSDADGKPGELARQVKVLKDVVTKGKGSSSSRETAALIYGCTVLQQAESITEENGCYKYQIGILYSWSGEMMRACGEILKGKTVKFKKGHTPMKKWIDSKSKKGVLAQWSGPRQFIDNEGNMWFLGISSARVTHERDDDEMASEIAEMQARGDVVSSFSADMKSFRKLETLTLTKDGANGAEEHQENSSMTLSESFKVTICGNKELYNGVVRHAPSGCDIRVVVYGVSSGSGKIFR